ncbi:hypothetical protein T459_09355 [Capsicum annuum]|uniref:Ubiquitin-like protease family profile domain-containing protein n=1 Tax=Capsicum annuum TaxID=4072 RepID=A0A2G2ZZ51_CAPAN|nr:hypothetical protein T459_09355 [Capsicum annuum]
MKEAEKSPISKQPKQDEEWITVEFAKKRKQPKTPTNGKQGTIPSTQNVKVKMFDAKSETRMVDHTKLVDKLVYNSKIQFPATGSSGGIVIMWDNPVLSINDIVIYPQAIHIYVKNYVEKIYRRYYPNDSDTVLSTQQNYAESVVVADNENTVNNIIKEFSIPAGFAWHLVDEVYVLMNCNQNFHWVLVVLALKDRRIRIYDSLSNLKNMDSSSEIQKLAVMLPTFRTDWSNLDAYRYKVSDTTQLLNTNPFEVEYVQNITQQDCDSLDCEIFLAGYAEYISEGMSVPSVGFEAAYLRMRYTSLLRNYGL